MSDLELKLMQIDAQADLEKARLALTNMQSHYMRLMRMQEEVSGSTTPEEVGDARIKMAQAEVDVRACESKLSMISSEMLLGTNPTPPSASTSR